MNRGRVFVISGPSGAGKDTVIDSLLARHPRQIQKSVSVTTRKPRPGEENGRDYLFLTKLEFKKRLNRGDFLEHFQVHENFYGSLLQTIAHPIKAGINVIMNIDVRGALAVKNKIPEAVLIFINAPSKKELERRIRKRHSDDEESIQLRLANAADEIETGETEFDHVVVNDALEKAIRDVEKIILHP